MAEDAGHDREGAYSLSTPQDHIIYYDKWAATYDADFAAAEGYIYPAKLAEHFASIARESDGPIADIGCGTGLVGEAMAALAPPAAPAAELAVDGLDISPGMLQAAKAKGVYRQLLVTDLTDPASLGSMAGAYGSLLSTGTFTFGHLGPPEFETALLLGRPGALCVLGVNGMHYKAQGFEQCLADLAAAGKITGLELVEVDMYRDVAKVAADSKTAQLVCFRLA